MPRPTARQPICRRCKLFLREQLHFGALHLFRAMYQVTYDLLKPRRGIRNKRHLNRYAASADARYTRRDRADIPVRRLLGWSPLAIQLPAVSPRFCSALTIVRSSAALLSAIAVCPATQNSQPWVLAAVICTTSRSASVRLLRLLISVIVR